MAYDVHVNDADGPKTFNLTWGQMRALKKCIKKIESTDGK